MKIADLFAGLRVRVDNSSFKAADKAIEDLKYALGGLGLYFASTWFKGLIDTTVALGGQLADTSQEIGVQVETLQQLGYAAQLSGSSLEGMTAALKILQRNAFAASKGGKEQAKAFREMGVSVKNADGTLRPAEDLLGDIADHISKLPDGTAKTGAAMKVFGKSGASLIPLLNEGRDGIAELRKEFVELGGQLDGEAVDSLEAYGDEQDKVKVALAGLRNTIVVALLPTLRELTQSFLEWIKANREWIQSGLRAAVAVLAAVFKALALVLRTVVKFIGWLVKHVEILTVIVLSLAGAFAVLRVQAMLAALMSGKSIGMLLAGWRLMATLAWAAARASIAAAIASAKAWVIANAPFILIAATIGLVILVLEDLYYWITGGESLFKDLYESAKKWLGDKFMEMIQRVTDWVIAKVQAMAGVVRGIFREIADIADSIFGSSVDVAQKTLRLKQGEKMGLKGEELDRFAGVDRSRDDIGLVGLAQRAQQTISAPSLSRFLPPAAQAAVAAGGGAPAVFQPTFNIQAPPGTDEQKIVEISKNAFADFFNGQLQRARAGAGK